ncbi:hypothetical protein E2C01_091202 [Portunus trituberculatus]|uniref:Uncharacterized protein n=1 Tax=Portunus trituberculatus TaxID=210409 RepID=A0A5B7JIJ1_PORTR|nr:hypothetical protein [Portunus trituberculatus]
MERKNTLEWYKEKEAPIVWMECKELQVVGVRSIVCQMYDIEEDETVEHVICWSVKRAADPKAWLRSDPESPVASRLRSRSGTGTQAAAQVTEGPSP